MRLPVIERRADAIRTGFRLLVCFLPALTWSIWFRQAQLSKYDPLRARLLFDFQQRLAASCVSFVLGCFAAIFAMWQIAARHPLSDDRAMGWLAVHGWRGEPELLPQRGLLPSAEVIGLLLVTAAGTLIAPAVLLIVPMVWSLTRLWYVADSAIRQHPYLLGTGVQMMAAVILMFDRIGIAGPLLAGAILIMEYVQVKVLRAHAASLSRHDIPMPVPESSAPSVREDFRHPKRRRTETARDHRQLIWPHWALQSDVRDLRPPWPQAVWFSAVSGLSVCCIVSRLAAILPEADDPTVEPRLAEMIGLMPLTCAVLSGPLFRVLWYAPFVWRPRLGIRARMNLLRPIVWSWDRFWLPSLVAPGIVVVAFGHLGLLTAPGIGLVLFVQMLFALRPWPSPVDWQMTSDSRIRSTPR